MIGVRYLVAVSAVLCVGLLAGLLVGTGMAASTAKGLPEASWTLRFQLEDARFSKVMPPAFLITLAVLIGSAALLQSRGRWLFATAAVLMLFVLVFTGTQELPLNRQIQSWTAGKAPLYWKTVRDRWLVIHVIRTTAGIAAFVCAASGLANL